MNDSDNDKVNDTDTDTDTDTDFMPDKNHSFGSFTCVLHVIP